MGMIPYRVGEKVVCVHDQLVNGPRLYKETMVVKGQIYTIREVFDSPSDVYCYTLEEIVNPIHRYRAGYREMAFQHWRFRRLVNKYTIDELLAKCDPSAPLSKEEREWLDAPPVGEEVI